MKKMVACFLMIVISTIGFRINAQQSDSVKGLTPKQASIVPIAAYTATGNQVSLKDALNNGLDAGLSINEIKEVLVQLYAYAGFPRSLNAINTLQSVVNERKQRGKNDIIGKEPSGVNYKQGKFEFGKGVQTALTGTAAIGKPQQYVPVIDTFLKEHLFADIFSRDNLDYKSREIATISALASMSGAEGQLLGHLNVGRNVGLTEQELRDITFSIATQSIKSIFPKGARITNNNFTGDVWLNSLVNADSINQIAVGSVTFEPGARTKWHSHPAGQIILALDGIGYYQEKGSAKIIVKRGDVIKCLPNIPHWHGASTDTEFVQVAITGREKGETVWLEAVTDEEYHKP